MHSAERHKLDWTNFHTIVGAKLVFCSYPSCIHDKYFSLYCESRKKVIFHPALDQTTIRAFISTQFVSLSRPCVVFIIIIIIVSLFVIIRIIAVVVRIQPFVLKGTC